MPLNFMVHRSLMGIWVMFNMSTTKAVARKEKKPPQIKWRDDCLEDTTENFDLYLFLINT